MFFLLQSHLITIYDYKCKHLYYIPLLLRHLISRQMTRTIKIAITNAAPINGATCAVSVTRIIRKKLASFCWRQKITVWSQPFLNQFFIVFYLVLCPYNFINWSSIELKGLTEFVSRAYGLRSFVFITTKWKLTYKFLPCTVKATAWADDPRSFSTWST